VNGELKVNVTVTELGSKNRRREVRQRGQAEGRCRQGGRKAGVCVLRRNAGYSFAAGRRVGSGKVPQAFSAQAG